MQFSSSFSRRSFWSRSSFLCVISALLVSLSSCSSEPEKPLNFSKVVTIAGKDRSITEPFGIVHVDGATYVSDGESGSIFRINDGAKPEIFASGLDTPSAMAVASDGRLIVADTGANKIVAIDKGGKTTTIVGGERGIADGSAEAAKFDGPIGVAVDKNGKIYVADTYNDRICVIENGTVRTLAGNKRGFADGVGTSALFDTPLGISIWGEDKLLVADSGNCRIRVVESDGRVWTLVGNENCDAVDGAVGDASLYSPTAISVDKYGVIYIADGNAIRAIGRRVLPYLETLSATHRGLSDGIPKAAKFNRPSGIALNEKGEMLVADSDNGLVRKFTIDQNAAAITAKEIAELRYSAAEFRELQPGRWPYQNALQTREIAGTLGEIRGEMKDRSSQVWFHNGLDIPGAYGETARFVRDEKVLDPDAAANFETLRELLRLPTMGYIHIRLGRDSTGKSFNDPRFKFDVVNGKAVSVRVPRGVKFKAGEAIGSLNALNHVHLIAGRPGAEMNALDALILPGISDSIAPVIENVTLFDESWAKIETATNAERINLSSKTRVVVRAYDRKDGNAERRRLAPYKIGYALRKANESAVKPQWNVSFEKMPADQAVSFVYADGSKSGATGETIFNFIATNTVAGDVFHEGFIDPASLGSGNYILTVFASDFFGNVAEKDVLIEVTK